MKFVVLLENHALDKKLKQEHGLSVYVEKDDFHMVLDMGETGLFMKNAEKLGIDLSKLDAIAFSHNHYDHSGGFARFLELNSKAKIYMSSHAAEPHYNADGKYIGVDIIKK